MKNSYELIDSYCTIVNKHIVDTLYCYYKNKPNIIFGTIEYNKFVILKSLEGTDFIVKPVLKRFKTPIYYSDYDIHNKLLDTLLKNLKYQNVEDELLYLFLCTHNNMYVSVDTEYNYADMINYIAQDVLIVEHRIALNG